MESPTYTVLATGTHTDSTTGVRYKVKSGEVITMQRAVNLGLPGAVMPTIHGYPSLASLSDVTLTSPQDDDVLTRSGSGWINAAPSGGGGSLTNEVANGTFGTAGVTGWYGLFEDEALSNSGGLFIVGMQSTGGSIQYDPSGGFDVGFDPADWGIYLFSIRIQVAADGSFPGTGADVVLRFEFVNGPAIESPVVTLDDQWRQLSHQFVVPAGADGVWPTISFSGMSADTQVSIDNVIVANLGTVAL